MYSVTVIPLLSALPWSCVLMVVAILCLNQAGVKIIPATSQPGRLFGSIDAIHETVEWAAKLVRGCY